MKICTIIGARPQFIKAAVLSRHILKNYSQNEIKEILIHTGQHYDSSMSNIFFKQMDIPFPAYNLGIQQQFHGAMTGQMLIEIEKVIFDEKPDFIVVYGDTNSTMAGALIGAKSRIPVAHIEAGLRSFDKTMPEEINRIVTDHVSTYLFCPTDTAITNLKNEGITNTISDKHRIIVENCGDIMYDAFLFYTNKLNDNVNLVFKKFDDIDYIPQKSNFILMTLHRDFNVDYEGNLDIILKSINQSNSKVIFPVHPRTMKTISSKLPHVLNYQNLIFLKPVGYFEMLWLELHADKIVTDSGGVQKEAFFARKQCITLRNTTEWVELVDMGVNTLCPINEQKILKAINKSIMINHKFEVYPYGKGATAQKIIEVLTSNIR